MTLNGIWMIAQRASGQAGRHPVCLSSAARRGFSDFSKEDVVTYHLAFSGQLDRFDLPEKTASERSWALSDGRLQLTPPGSTTLEWVGTRWGGEKFVPIFPKGKSPIPLNCSIQSRLQNV
jgi:hypothetical protein